MAYSKNIPQATDRPSDSQSLMLANFTAIDTVNSINHVAFDDASGKQGMHKFVTFPTQGASTGSYPTTAATDVAFFSQTSKWSGETEIAVRKQGNGSVYEFTAGIIGSSGYTVLPSGLLIKWMTSGAFSGESAIAWPTGANIPVFQTVYQITVTPSSNVAGDPNIASTLKTWVSASTTIYNSKRITSAANSHFARIVAFGTVKP